MAEQIKAYYVASTHWDREWYEPFQHFRYHLVEILDELLALMQRDPQFRVFQCDGQSIPIEDYLEIRPEQTDLVLRYCTNGRLRLGPWYTMPDEWIVAGESLVRNLEEGLRVARDHGYASRVGFICDLFGHTSQMPQILQGFGIDNAFVFRGVNEASHKGCFRWKSPDGSEVVTFRFGPREGYFDYAADVRKGFDVKNPFDLEVAAQRLPEYVKMQQERVGLDVVLLFDGGDHMPIEPQTSQLLARLREALPNVTVEHTGLEEFAAALNERKEQIPRVFTGELRAPGKIATDGAWLIPGVLASRIKLKLANRRCETDLTLWSEPLSHFANRLIGHEYPHTYLRRAWRYVLENHAHDSICGCSPDQVHKDMEFRFDQAKLICQKLTNFAMEAIADAVELPDQQDEDFGLVVFNPTQQDIDGPVDVELWFDEKTQKLFTEFFAYEAKVGFRLYGADGQELPYDYLSYSPQRRRFRRRYRKIPMGQECIVVTATVPLKIPALGYTTITCTPEKMFTRHAAGHIVGGDRVLENEHLRVTVEANGSLTLLDKCSKQTYSRLLVFEDRADIGDGWFHGIAVNDQIYSSTASHADVAVVADGAQKATLRIINRMHVPKCFEFDKKMRRSPEKTELVIQTDVTLRAGADHLELHTEIDNQVRDHRIRVMFESGAQTDTYVADSAFDVVTRPIALPADSHAFKELSVETTPQQYWTAVHDKQRGVAVVAPGLPETAVRDEPQRTLALTLLRGFRRTIFTDGEEGGQTLGQHVFDYRLVPLKGAPDAAQLNALGQRVAAGVKAFQVSPTWQVPAERRKLPRTLGLLRLAPNQALLTSVRRRPESEFLELRLFNPGDKALTETLTLHEPMKSAALTNLEGRELEMLKVNGNRVDIPLPPRKIVTVAIEL